MFSYTLTQKRENRNGKFGEYHTSYTVENGVEKQEYYELTIQISNDITTISNTISYFVIDSVNDGYKLIVGGLDDDLEWNDYDMFDRITKMHKNNNYNSCFKFGNLIFTNNYFIIANNNLLEEDSYLRFKVNNEFKEMIENIRRKFDYCVHSNK